MSTKNTINELWNRYREAINLTYENSGNIEPENCLRDYAEDISWCDSMARLLGREAANERQHRSNRPSVPGFSIETAAKLILLNNMVEGSKLTEMPRATEFLVFRQTAAEARLIGFLTRNFITTDMRNKVNALDYAKLMQPDSIGE